MEKYKNVRKRPEKKPRFDKVSIMLRQSSTMIMRRKSRPNVELGLSLQQAYRAVKSLEAKGLLHKV